jgi:hypothetical protein
MEYLSLDFMYTQNNQAWIIAYPCKIATDEIYRLAEGENLSNLFATIYFIRGRNDIPPPQSKATQW